jgi:hypothetical protein
MKLIPEKLVNFIQIRYKTRLNKEKLMELLTNYNSVYDESQKLLISMVFEILFGLTIESLNNLALNYNGRELSLDDTIKEMQQSINDLSSKIDILTQDNEELRENYWRLNQSIVKQTGK